MNSMKIFENPRNTMEILRKQEASLEPSKGFFRGSRSYLTDVSIHVPKSMNIYENKKNIHKINENLRNTMKVVRGQASLESSKGFYKGSRPHLTDVSIHVQKSLKIYKIYENL